VTKPAPLLVAALLGVCASLVSPAARAQENTQPPVQTEAARRAAIDRFIERSPVVPPNHWAYAVADALDKHGVPLRGGDMQSWPGRGVTRFEFAVTTARLADFFPALSEEQAKRPLGKWLRSTGYGLLQKMAREFAPELAVLNVDVAKLQQRLAAYAPPVPRLSLFEDAPPRSHWAAAAVEKLRQAGILIGDEKGRFNPVAPGTKREHGAR